MPSYKFDHNPEAAESGSQSRQIPVNDGQVSFHLGSEKPAQLVGHYLGEKPTQPQPPKTEPTLKKIIEQGKSRFALKKGLFKVWHFLEFIAVTGVIFMTLFYIINFDSYSQLFLTKLNQLRGQINSNPYLTQEQLHNASVAGQKPLPIPQNAQSAKKQIPELTMAIAPPDDRIIVPRISQNVPIIRVPTDMLLRRDWAGLEKQVQEALRHGVVHFPGTAMPGEEGNIVVTGHSSYFPWDPGRFKDVFALLHQVNIGDRVVIYHEQKKYEYQIYDKKVVSPSQIEVLTQKGESRLTLITCTPVGTDLNRLVLLARQVSVK